MTLNYVVVTWTEQDVAQGELNGVITFTNSAALTAPAEGLNVPVLARTFSFVGGAGTTPPLLATDNADITQNGSWHYTVTTSIPATGNAPAQFNCYLPHASGGTQTLASLTPIP
jgi:hypothetical protein